MSGEDARTVYVFTEWVGESERKQTHLVVQPEAKINTCVWF